MVKATGNWTIFLATALLVFTIASSKHVKHLKRHNAQVHYYGKSHRKADVPGSKRQLWQFKGMIECVTGRSTFDFVNYGSYCGWGGSGIAVDELDRCCKVHDECYGEWDECRPKTNIYAYQLAGKHPNCQITCSPAPKKNTECERAICLCDKVAAECFARSHYNPKHKAPLFNLF